MLVVALWPVADRLTATVWLSSLLMLAAARWILAVGALSAKTAGSADFWLRGLLLSVFVSGLLWGIGALVLFSPQALQYQVFLAFILAGMAAGSVATGVYVPRAIPLFILPALLPLAARFLWQGGRLGIAMGAMTLVFIVVLLYTSRKLSETLRENVDYRLRHRGDVERLRRSDLLLRQTGRVASVGGWDVDLRTGEARSSEEACRIHEVEPGTLVTVERLLSFYPDEAGAQMRAALEAARIDGTPWDLELPMITARGNSRWVRSIGGVERAAGSIDRLFGAFQDITAWKGARQALAQSNRALTRLYEITSRQNASFQAKVHELLSLGTELFGLEMGIVSRIEDENYHVEHVVGPETAALAGAVFPLGETYCSLTLAADGPLGFSHVGASGVNGHPCYRRFGLESYLGAPLIVDGISYGTLNFSSAVPRDTPFDDAELSLVRLLSEWIGQQIASEFDRRQLTQSRTRLGIILESLAEGVYGLDAQGRTTFVNGAAIRMLGYDTAQELVGRPMHVTVHHSHVDGSPYPRDRCPVCAAVSDGASRQVSDEVFWRRDGSSFAVEYTVMPLRSGPGMEGAVVTFRDVTASAAAQRELKRQKGLFESLFRNAPDAVIFADPERRIRLINPAFTNLFGYGQAEIEGRGTDFLYAREEDFHAQGESRYNPCSVADPGQTYEMEYRRREGAVFPAETVGSAVRDAEGNLLGFIGQIRDITERRRMDRLKREFISTVSHELRTPLTSIRGALGLLAGGAVGELPAAGRDLVAVAARNSERLNLLIDDLLDIELIASGRLTFDQVTVPVWRLLEQALEANEGYARQFGVRLRLAGDEEAVVHVDVSRFLQIMANLISNAAKFSSPEADVEVRVTRDDKAVRIAVVDQGEGIPAAFHEAIFERFRQVDGSDSRRKGGSGLGLPITRSLVEEMGGYLELESAPGVGSTFTVVLPGAGVSADGASMCSPRRGRSPGGRSG